MIILQHYVCVAQTNICDFLKQNHVDFQLITDENSLKDRISFEIAENDGAFASLSELQLTECVVTRRILYEKKEIEESSWLTCTPTSKKIQLSNTDDSFLILEMYGDGKARHRLLTGKPFYISKPFRHSPNQHFWGADEVPNQLFCSEHAKRLLSRFEPEITFEPVYHSKIGEPIGDVYAIHIHHSLPKRAIDLSLSEEKFICPVCQKETFLPPPMLRIQSEFLDESHPICKTEEIFGWGGNYAAPINIISNAVYQFLKENQLLRGLYFEPVVPMNAIR